jgi:hypothetical protein
MSYETVTRHRQPLSFKSGPDPPSTIMPSILRYQPVKGIFTLSKVAFFLFVQTPYYIVSAIPRSWRPRRSWSFGRTLMVKLYRAAFTLEIQ